MLVLAGAGGSLEIVSDGIEEAGEGMRSALEWAEAKAMAAEGVTKTEIARRLGINRRTAAKLVEASESQSYSRAPARSMIAALIGGKADIFDLGRWPEVLLDRTKREWALLKDILDEQAAWPVGPIYGDKAFLWDLHQVLAIGYTDDGAGRARCGSGTTRTGTRPPRMRLDFRGDQSR